MKKSITHKELKKQFREKNISPLAKKLKNLQAITFKEARFEDDEVCIKFSIKQFRAFVKSVERKHTSEIRVLKKEHSAVCEALNEEKCIIEKERDELVALNKKLYLNIETISGNLEDCIKSNSKKNKNDILSHNIKPNPVYDGNNTKPVDANGRR